MKEEELKKLEKKLWESADKMRGAVPVSDYKFIILGLIFLKYISDAFEEKYQTLVEDGYGLEEDRDSYEAENVFYVPARARWEYLNAHSKDPHIGQIIDDALEEIERENPSLKGVLVKEFNSPNYRNVNLGEIIDLFTNIKIGSKEAQDKDILGRIYEYFLGQFAANELQKGGEFYTPACLVRTMVEILEPYEGRIYDPACGSGGMFVQSIKFIKRHNGNARNLTIYGQEKNPTTWKLAKMNLAIRGINNEGLGKFADDTFHNDLHKDLKADFVLANPPFYISDWGQEKLLDDPRWKYGIPPKGNANFAWVEHMVSKLSMNGKAAIILANGSMSATGDEGKIREKIIKSDLVECIISMPEKLFYTVSIPCSIWIINRNKRIKNKVLFIEADKLGHMISKKIRELSEEEIIKIASNYHKFATDGLEIDELDFAKVVELQEIENNNYILTPGRYISRSKKEEKIDIKNMVKNINENINNKLTTSIMSNLYKEWFIDKKSNNKNWIKIKLRDIIIKANTGADAIQKAPIVDNDTGIKCIRIGDLTNQRTYDDWGFCNVNEENYKRYKLNIEDIVVGRTSAIGINRLIIDDRPAVYNNGLIRISINKNMAYAKFIYIVLNTTDYFEYIYRIKKETSTRENMKLDYLLDYTFILPNIEVQKEFVRIYEEIEKYISGLVSYENIIQKLDSIIQEGH